MLETLPMPVALETWLPQFDAWLAAPTTGTVDQTLVHKHQLSNVLVRRAERVTDTEHHYACELVFPQDHAFFYEHPVDHVPGLALIEAGRQMGLLVAHRFYGVPTDGYQFLINALTTSFTTFASKEAPVFGHAEVTNVKARRGVASKMTFTGHYHQNGRSIGHITGTWTILSPELRARLARSSD